MKRCLVLLLVATACPSKQGPAGGGVSAGSGSAVATCADAHATVERLYRAEATDADAARRETWIADNTAMVLNDCAKDPAKRVPCIQRATSVADLENKCVAPLDDDGTEGEELRP